MSVHNPLPNVEPKKAKQRCVQCAFRNFKQTSEIVAVYIALESSRVPATLRAFPHICLSQGFVINPCKNAVMRPTQFRTQCVMFWERQVKLPHIAQIAFIKAFPKLKRQLFRQIFENSFSVFCPLFSVLFIFDNQTPDVPIHLQKDSVGLAIHLCAGFADDRFDIRNERVLQFHSVFAFMKEGASMMVSLFT